MSDIYQLGLARSLEHKMAKALADAGLSLVAPGALGAGVSVTQSNDTEHTFDPIRGMLTITGVVKIDVCGLSKSA
jgi:hypothetical protein